MQPAVMQATTDHSVLWCSLAQCDGDMGAVWQRAGSPAVQHEAAARVCVKLTCSQLAINVPAQAAAAGATAEWAARHQVHPATLQGSLHALYGGLVQAGTWGKIRIHS